jgi:hypothetical protein
MIKYKVLEFELNRKIIEKTDENGIISYVPMDPANSDYQAYLNPEQDNPVGGN